MTSKNEWLSTPVVSMTISGKRDDGSELSRAEKQQVKKAVAVQQKVLDKAKEQKAKRSAAVVKASTNNKRKQLDLKEQEVVKAAKAAKAVNIVQTNMKAQQQCSTTIKKAKTTHLDIEPIDASESITSESSSLIDNNNDSMDDELFIERYLMLESSDNDQPQASAVAAASAASVAPIGTIVRSSLNNNVVPRSSPSTDDDDDESFSIEYVCVVCFESECRTVFKPCNHRVCCAACACAVQQCPVCCKKITAMFALSHGATD